MLQTTTTECSTSALDKALLAKTPSDELQKLVDAGVMIPEVMAIVGFGGDGHKDLWKHTKVVVDQAVPRRAVRWGALFHDIGKPQCFEKRGKKISFHGHEAVSAKIFNQAAKRLGMDPDFRRHVRFLVHHLGQVEAYLPSWTDSAVRRLGNQLGDHLEDIVALSRADITTANLKRRQRKHMQLKELRDRIVELRLADAQPAALPKGLGTALTEALGVPPSEALGDLMKALREAVEAGKLPAQGPFEVYVEYARQISPDH